MGKNALRTVTSALLDLLRVSAAIGVVLAHIMNPFFAENLPNLESLGHACVALFFVLSGYVIAWVTNTRERDLKSYLVARFSRIYSVLIPAIIVTLMADYVSHKLDPAFYQLVVGDSESIIPAILRSILFINESYGVDHNLLSNSPIWSLGYEVPYYLIFACIMFFTSSWRAGLITVIVFLEGPAVWILFPIWLLGVFTYLYIGRRPPSASRAIISFVMFIALLGLSPWLARIQTNMYNVESHISNVLSFGRSNQFIFFYTFGALIALLIVVVDSSEAFIKCSMPGLHAFIRQIASSTFSIYLFHYPILVLFYSVTHYDRANRVNVGVVFFATLFTCVLLSYISERQKKLWQRPVSAAVGAIIGVFAASRRGLFKA